MIDFILGSPSIHPQPAQAGLKLGKLLRNDFNPFRFNCKQFLCGAQVCQISGCGLFLLMMTNWC